MKQPPFDECYERIPEAGCWIWTGSSFQEGYGRYTVNKKQIGAHRVSWMRAHGVKLGPKDVICHRCDVPSCINPDHLFIGTQLENIADRHKKGRTARGETNGRAKFSVQEVIRIRSMEDRYGLVADLAREYNCCETAIQKIRWGKSWFHLKDESFVRRMLARKAYFQGKIAQIDAALKDIQ